MVYNYLGVLEQARRNGPVTLAVAVAQDEDVLEAVLGAWDEGIVTPILVGDRGAIEALLAKLKRPVDALRIVDEPDKTLACEASVRLVANGEAQTLMKGGVDTPTIMRAVLSKQNGMKLAGFASHVGVLFSKKYDRFLIITDAALNIAPDVDQKADMIRNAVKVAHALGISCPKVACVCASEKVSPKQPATLDAMELVRRNDDGEITGCLVGGPFGFDNAVSEEAARHKGITHPCAGHADVFLMSCIEAANTFVKCLEYFADVEKGGIIMGGNLPIVLTSRSSSAASKLNSIALAVLVASHLNEQ